MRYIRHGRAAVWVSGMGAEMTTWKYQAKGGEWGPMTDEQISYAIASGDVKTDTLVQKDDDPRWLMAWLTDLRTQLEAVGARPNAVTPEKSTTAVQAQRPSRKRSDWMSLACLVIVVAALGYYFFGPTSFGSADIDAMKRSIRAKFEEQGGTVVEEVQLIKESGQKVTGFVKLRINSIPVTKVCDATMAEDGRQYLWRCQ